MNTDRVVSSEQEELILVDGDDNETGFLSKAAAHDGDGILHRAFSLFLFDADGKLLLQQRSSGKRLWPGFWSNSCCSHPRRGETMELATARRLSDELNVEAELEFVYKFAYQAVFDENGSENELCHVYLGTLRGAVSPNVSEIADIGFLTASELSEQLRDNAGDYTPWLRMEWASLQRDYADSLARYT